MGGEDFSLGPEAIHNFNRQKGRWLMSALSSQKYVASGAAQNFIGGERTRGFSGWAIVFRGAKIPLQERLSPSS
jgi:hypothetical protein